MKTKFILLIAAILTLQVAYAQRKINTFIVENPNANTIDIYVVAVGGDFTETSRGGLADTWQKMGLTLSAPIGSGNLGVILGAAAPRPDNSGIVGLSSTNTYTSKNWNLARQPSIATTTPSFSSATKDYFQYSFALLAGGSATNFVGDPSITTSQQTVLEEGVPVYMGSIALGTVNFQDVELVPRKDLVPNPSALYTLYFSKDAFYRQELNADPLDTYTGSVYKEDIIHINNRYNETYNTLARVLAGKPLSYGDTGVWRGGTDVIKEPDLTDASRNLTIYYGPAVKTMKGAVSNTKFLENTKIIVNPDAGFKTTTITPSAAAGEDSVVVLADATGYGQYIGPSITGRIQQYAGTEAGWRNVALPIQPANIATNKLSLGGAPTNSDATYTSYNAAPDACGTFGNAINTVNIIQFEGGASSAEPHEWHSFAPSAAIGGTRGYSMFFGNGFFSTNGTISVKGNFNDPSNVGTFDYVHLSPHATGATGASQQNFTGAASCTGQGANEQAADRKANWDGWALVANPFPCGLSVDQFCTDNGNIPTTNIRIWSKDQGFTITNGQPTTPDYQYVAPGAGANIAPMQAFWVKSAVSGAAVPALVFTDAQRVFSTESFFKTTAEVVELIAMNNADSSANYAILSFDATATKGYDFSFDSYVLSQPGNTRPQLGFHNEYTANGVQVVAPLFVNTVNDMTLNDSYPLRFWSRSAGNYSFYINQDKLDPSWKVYIEDTKVAPGTSVEITNQAYTFSYVTGDSPTRFILHFVNTAFGGSENALNPTGLIAWGTTDGIEVRFDGVWSPTADIYVSNLLGQTLFVGKGVSTENNYVIPASSTEPQVYMVTVVSEGLTETVKVVK